ncbi:Zinc finger CCCH domain-containing protein 30, partial [Mucuna pruriens]
MARMILRAGYYLTKMEVDCCDHVKRYRKFQVYANNIHISFTPLNSLMVIYDRPIEPRASNGHHYLNVTKHVVVKFIKQDLICQYGLPSHIITNNGTSLNNKMMPELWIDTKSKKISLAAAMNMLSESPSLMSVMSPPFTPLMSPSANGMSHSSVGWSQPNVPAFHLPG